MALAFYNTVGGGVKTYSGTLGALVPYIEKYTTKIVVPVGSVVNLSAASASWGCTAYSGSFISNPTATLILYSDDGGEPSEVGGDALLSTAFTGTDSVQVRNSGALDIDLVAGTYWVTLSVGAIGGVPAGGSFTVQVTENTGETTISSDLGLGHTGSSGPKTGGAWVISDNVADLYFSLTGTAQTVPTKANSPTPADSATDVDFTGFQLSWTDGGGATSYNVYMGPSGSLSLVSSGQAGTTYTTDATELESLFGVYPVPEDITWRIDSINGAGTTTGDVWSFRSIPAINDAKLGTEGLFIVAGTNQGLRLSTDFGSNWTESLPDSDDTTSWPVVATSSDGTYMVVSDSSGNVYRSANGGSSWSSITPAGSDTFVPTQAELDSAGAYGIIIGANSTTSKNSAYITSDSGATWSVVYPSESSVTWTSCSISNGGQLIFLGRSGYLYASFDYGVNWVIQSPTSGTDSWAALTSSPDGTIGFVADSGTANKVYRTTGYTSVPTISETPVTSYTLSLLDDTSAGEAATTLGLGTGDSPTMTGLTLSGLTASRLTYSDGDKALSSVSDLTAWVGGTANQITSTSDGDGSITLSTPQDIDTGAGVNFNSATLVDDLYIGAIGLNDTSAGASGCELIGTPAIGTPTYSTLCSRLSLFNSVGRATGGTVTDAGSETVNVAAGTGFIRATDSDVAELLSFDWSASNGVSIPTDSTRWVGVEYNSGSPQVVVKTTYSWDLDTEFPLAEVINQNGELHILNNPWWVTDGITNVIERIQAQGNLVRDAFVGGLSISVSGTRNIAVTAGTLWSRLNEFAISALDTSVTGTFEYYWYNGVAGTWSSSDVSQYSVTQWNDTTLATLQNLTTNWYANLWVYAESDDTIAILYPQAQYATAAAAEDEALPTVTPTHIDEHALLLGRITIRQGNDTPILVQSAFDTAFANTAVSTHNNLSGLQGGTASEYYHLTSTDYGYVSGVNAQSVLTTASPTFVDLTLSAPSSIYNLSHDSFADFDTDEHFLQTAITNVSTALSTGILTVTTGTGALGVTTDNSSNWDTAYSHSQLSSGNPHSVTPTELGLVIGTDVQAHSNLLDDWASPQDTAENVSFNFAMYHPNNGLAYWVQVGNALNVTTGDPHYLNVVEADISIANLSDYDSNKFVDHTAVTFTAGTGLTGGGDISSNRSFAVDGVLEDLDTLGAPSSDGEFIVATGAGAFAYESGNTARTSLGLGEGDSVTFQGVTSSSDIATTGGYSFLAKSTGISHSVTDVASANVGAYLRLLSSTNGGIEFGGITDTDYIPCYFRGIHGNTNPTLAAMQFSFGKSDGGTGGTGLATTEVGFQFLNWSTPVITVLGSGNMGFGTASPQEDVHAADTVRADTAFNLNGTDGLSGTLTLDDGANWRVTLTFAGGILTGQTTGASSAAAATWA